MKPLLKWVGGKSQILPQVLSKIPDTLENYYEPFVGGASVLIGVLETKTIKGRIVAGDVNPLIIQLYQDIKDNPDELIQEIEKIASVYKSIEEMNGNRTPEDEKEARESRESYYYWIRKHFNRRKKFEDVKTSALLVFLNKTCFRGVYREGPNGFNVPFGNYKNPDIMDPEHIRGLHRLFKRVEFVEASFEKVLGMANKGDFVYLDPPYVPETETSFVGYVKDGFNKHQELFDSIDALTENGIGTLHSNSDTLMLKRFKEPTYQTQVISCKRSINSKNPDQKTNDVLISNKVDY
jgi:DNA adenine methylase